MSDALEYLGYGLLLGLSGGLTPGPVTTLVITHTLRHGFREGLKIAIAPLVTDLPLILLTVFVFSRLADAGMLIGGIALVGAGYLAYLARETFNAPPLSAVPSAEGPRSLRTGLIANVLNPNPYLFWSVVGAPTLYRAVESSTLAAALFLGGLYLSLVGGKVLIAALAARGRGHLDGATYRLILRALGVALGVFALVFLWNGITQLMGTAAS